MKLLTCASYYSTGSSAVTDLITECDNVHNMGDYEFRFVQDPDGISDLEYNLVENNHRHNSGYALKRYEKNVKFLAGNKLIKKYNIYFGKEWKRLSAEYVQKLVATEYKGYWHQDLRDKGKLAYFLERLFNKIMHNVFHAYRERNFSLFLGKNTNYATYPEEKFYEYTKEYIDKLFSYANKDGKEFVMADQLVPASNTMRYMKYFTDLKAICVDRDPRDVFVLEKEAYHGSVVPRNVEEFCIWYKATRAHKQTEQDDPEKVMRINFEDMLYHYDEMRDKILEFCGIDKSKHVNAKKYFNPDVSIKNAEVYKRYPKYEKDIAYIEKELKEYLYVR